MLGLSPVHLIELSQSAPGRAQLRQVLEDAALSEESANALFDEWLSQDFWPSELWASGHPLLVCAVLAGGLKAPISGLESLWKQAAATLPQIKGFESRWVEALHESQGWPLLAPGLDEIHRWLRSRPADIDRALDWLAGLRWHAAAPRVADTAPQYDHGKKCCALLEDWASRTMSQVRPGDNPPRLVAHYVRGILTSWHKPDGPEILILRFRQEPRFVQMVKAVLSKLRDNPGYHRALGYLALIRMPMIEQEVEDHLRSCTFTNDFIPSASLFTYLLERTPSTMLIAMEQNPWLIVRLGGCLREVGKTVEALSQDHQIHFRGLLRANGRLEDLAELGDRSVIPDLKKLEQSRRSANRADYFPSLGRLVHLCGSPDPEIMEALAWRLQNCRNPENKVEAARLQAILGVPEALWERAQTKNERGELASEPEDLLALALAGKHSPELSAKIATFLSATALGNPLSFFRDDEKQIAALMGLFALHPQDLVDKLRAILEQAGPLSVRLLAAEALERLNALAPEQALLPIWRTLSPAMLPRSVLGGMQLYDESVLREVVCGVQRIHFTTGQGAWLLHAVEKAGFTEMPSHERRRTFDQPYFLTEILKSPLTNPDCDRQLTAFSKLSHSSIGSSIYHHWKGMRCASKEWIELTARLLASERGQYGLADYVRFAHEHQICDERFINAARQNSDTANQRDYDACIAYLDWCSKQDAQNPIQPPSLMPVTSP